MSSSSPPFAPTFSADDFEENGLLRLGVEREALDLAEEEEKKKTEFVFNKLILNSRHYNIDYRGHVIEDKETIALAWCHDKYIDMVLDPENKEFRMLEEIPKWDGFWAEKGKELVPLTFTSAAFSVDDVRVLNLISDTGFMLSCHYHHKAQACTPFSFVAMPREADGSFKMPTNPREAEMRAKARKELRIRFPAKGFFSGDLSMATGAVDVATLRQIRYQKHVQECPLSDEARYALFLYRVDGKEYVGKTSCTCPRQLTDRQLELLRVMQQDVPHEQDAAFFGLQCAGWGITSVIGEYVIQKVFELQRIWLKKKVEIAMLYLGSTEEKCRWFFSLLKGLCAIQGLCFKTDDDNKELLEVVREDVKVSIHIKPHKFITIHNESEHFSFNTDWMFVDDMCDAVKEDNLFYFLMTHVYVSPLQCFVFGTSDDWDIRHRTEGRWLAARQRSVINKYKRLEYQQEKQAKKKDQKNNKKNNNK